MRKTSLLLIPLILMLVLISSCNKQDWSATEKSDVKYTISNTEVTLAGKPFVMNSLQLELTDLLLTGERIQSDPIAISKTINGTIDFLNPSEDLSFDIPIGTYTEMILSSSLEENGTPSINIIGTYFLASNDTYEVSIALDIEAQYLIQLKDTDGASTILIDDTSTKKLQIVLDTETLFSEVNPGLWNAAAVTSQNGFQTIVVNELNNTNIYNAINTKISESLIANFQ